MRIAGDRAHSVHPPVCDVPSAFRFFRWNELVVGGVAEKEVSDFGESAETGNFVVSDACVPKIHPIKIKFE